MKRLALIVLIGYIGFHFSDVRGGGLVGAYLAPILVSISIIAAMLWLKSATMNRKSTGDEAGDLISISPSDLN